MIISNNLDLEANIFKDTLRPNLLLALLDISTTKQAKEKCIYIFIPISSIERGDFLYSCTKTYSLLYHC